MTEVPRQARRFTVCAVAACLFLAPATAGAERWDYVISVPVNVTDLDPQADYVQINCRPDAVDTLYGFRDMPSGRLDASGSFSGMLLFRHELPNAGDSANLTTYRCTMEICDDTSPNGGERCDYPDPGGSGYNGVSADPPPVWEYSGSFR